MFRLKYFWFVFFLSWVLVQQAKAQEETCKWVPSAMSQKGFLLDSLSVLEETIRISDAHGKTYTFKYQLSDGTIKVLEAGNSLPDSLLFCYRTMPYALHQQKFRRTLMEDYDSMAMFRNLRVQASPAFDFREELFPTNQLNKSGNLTRGISFGNSQNLFVNSSLNLQMNGKLAENLNIRASISDQNVPFQPEGNTQQIQDFDRVLVELYNDNFNLAAGDVVLQQRTSEFLRYYKNVQGAQFTTQYKLSDKWKASSQFAASVAKGRFASVQLPISEGVLGPYRIPGPNNERFVIMLANSERVFLDGRLLQRGFNYDYVIDYNQGEITFTPNVLITQYTRIRVDYEFAERNYTRSILAANHQQDNGKLSFYMNFYREQDNRNRPLFVELSDSEKVLLASVGNDLSAAAVPRVDSVGFDPNRILYKRVQDTDLSGNPIEFFEYSTDPNVAHFAVSFSEVGQGKGDYVRARQLANGPVYAYVQRVNGVPQGNYSVLSPLPAPSKKQMFTSGSRYKVSAFEEVFTELAFSQQDVNLFSTIGNENNGGFGIKSGFISKDRPLDKIQGYKLNVLGTYEYNSTNFSFIDRLRYIEFDRDWSLSPEDAVNPGHERIFRARLGMEKDQNNQVAYDFNFRNRGSILSGIQQQGVLHQQLGKRLFLRNDFFLLRSEVRDLRSFWSRYNGNLEYRTKLLVPGYRFSLDRNTVSLQEKDSVVSTAMNFLEHTVYLKSNDTLPYSFILQASAREDRFPVNGVMVPDTEARQALMGLKRKFGGHDLSATFTYRTLDFIRLDNAREITVLGKVDYSGSFAKGNLRNELSYALGNGREFRRDFVFVPVPTGEGTHTWRDDNGDGIQQFNEFYLAVNPEEKNFIKIFVPTNEFVQAYSTIFNYRLNAKFPDAWRRDGGIKKFLQRFSNTSSISIDKKVTSDGFWDRVNPWLSSSAQDDLISVRQVIRSSVFFNRASAKYGFDFTLFDSQNKQLLAGGFEDLVQKDWRLNTRYNLSSSFNLRLIGFLGSRGAASDFMENRNYRIQQSGLGPELTWQPTGFLRSTMMYQYTEKNNEANTEFREFSTLHQVGFDLRYAKAIKTTLNANLKYVGISYNGTPNTPVGYEMLQALTVGDNFTWTLSWLQKIGEGLQMNMVYEGRNSQGLGRIVHIGRMQVTALF